MALQYNFKAQTIIDQGRVSQKALNDLKDWLPQSGFPEIPDELLALFLLSCDNSLQETQSTIQAYFRIKNETPEMFSDRDIDSAELVKIRNVVSCVSIPKRLDNNTVIHFFNLVDLDYRNFEWVPAMKLAFMLLDISQRSDPPNELVVVLDMKGTGFMHLTRLKVWAVKKFLEFLQEAMPLKIKMIHILNTNYIFDKLLAVAKVFMKTELMSIIKSHPPGVEMSKIYEHIPAASLPKEYGGDLPSLQELNEDSIRTFRELKAFFEAEEKLIHSYK